MDHVVEVHRGIILGHGVLDDFRGVSRVMDGICSWSFIVAMGYEYGWFMDGLWMVYALFMDGSWNV